MALTSSAPLITLMEKLLEVHTASGESVKAILDDTQAGASDAVKLLAIRKVMAERDRQLLIIANVAEAFRS